MSDEDTTGGCHCGAIRYRTDVPGKFAFLCHCDNCRKLNGGSRLSGVGIPRESFAIVKGEPRTYRYRGGKDEIELSFCGECGTPLVATPKAHPDIVVIRLNSMDDQEARPPKKSLFAEQACTWDRVLGEP